MKKIRIQRLLSALLAGAAEPSSREDPGQPLDDQRLREALTGRSPLDTGERHALLRSPAARRRIYFQHQLLRAETLYRWAAAGIHSDISYQAAADAAPRVVTLSDNPDFTLTLFPLDVAGSRWHLHLKLSARVQASLSGIAIRLLDDAGRQWLAGRPDADGEIGADYPFAESPVDLLIERRLQIEPW
jgi:hypothetical protein